MSITRRLSTFPGLILLVALGFFAAHAVAGEGAGEVADEGETGEHADAMQQGVDTAEGLDREVVEAVEEAGRTPRGLCEQLKDPAQSGLADLDAFMHHVTEDALVLWGWEPGGDRTVPPLSHEEFVEQAQIWVDSGGACPE